MTAPQQCRQQRLQEHAAGSHKLVCSLAAGWTSLRVQGLEYDDNPEPFESPICPDQFVAVVTKGRGYMEGFSDGFWRRTNYEPGSVGMISSGHTKRLRWRPLGPVALEALHLCVPPHFFAGAEDEYRRAGSSFREQPLNSLYFCDPVVSRIALSLADAVSTGAPDLYAQSAGQFLATHLLSMQSGWPDPSQDKRRPGTLGKHCLAHILDYMKAHYAESLSLDQLAAEVGVSRFHFVRLFKEGFGIAPHHCLIRIRMDVAASFLSDTSLSVMDIALACGYQSAAHFTSAFQKHFAQAPSLYRQNIQSSVNGIINAKHAKMHNID